MTDLADSASSGGDGRVLGLTRAGVWVLFVLAAANGLFLYFAAGHGGHRLRVVDQARR